MQDIELGIRLEGLDEVFFLEAMIVNYLKDIYFLGFSLGFLDITMSKGWF